jgi:predicted ATPase/DNA-binding SARP family transcriptional activator
LEFAMLGPLEVRRGGAVVSLRRGLPRRVLISLLLRAGRTVPADVLIEELWADDLPTNAANALQSHVSYLRRALALPSSGDTEALRTVDGGYRLDVPPQSIDVVCFEDAVSTASEHVRSGTRADAATALELIASALALWRGTPLADVASEQFAMAEVQRLLDLRVVALEHEIDARLLVGDHEGAVPRLRQLVVEHPLRERFWAQLALASYRCGRQADALRAIDAARTHLIEELGVDPGRELQELQRALLDQDPCLDWVESPPGAACDQDTSDASEHRREAPARASFVPAPLTRLIGRADELVRVRSALAANRMVTLSGAGGIGKTRLALAVAQAECELAPTWFIELGDLTDAAAVSVLVARSLGVTPGANPLDAISLSIGHHACLLVLDTCEHVLDGAAATSHHLLRTCPGLRLLATSRQPLGIVGEVVWPVPPLTVPRSDASFHEVRQGDATQLFLERARAARADFELDESNAAAIVSICRELDGLPLAIELAAARSAVLSAATILDRLDDRLELLSRRGHAGDRRQQSLHATIDWSVELLDDEQRTFYRRLGAFAGRFTLEAAGPVAASGLTTSPLELVTAMVDRSLVVSDGNDGYHMLDTVRAHAGALLDDDRVDRDDTYRRLARWMAEYAAAADPKLRTAEQEPTLVQLRLRMPNMRAALRWCFTGGDVTVGARLAMSLGWFWALEEGTDEATEWLTRALEEPGLEPVTRARLLELAGFHTHAAGDVPTARRLLEEAVELWERLADSDRSAFALMYLGVARWWFDDAEGAAAAQDSAIERARAAGDDWCLGCALLWRASTAAGQGDEAHVVELLTEARARMEAAGEPRDLGWIVKELGEAALRAGDVDRGLALVDEAISILEGTGWAAALAVACTTVGRALVASGRHEEARVRHLAALRAAVETGQPFPTANALEGCAEALAATDEPIPAVELLGTAAAVRAGSAVGTQTARPWRDLEGRERERWDVILRSVGDDASEEAYERGWQTSPTEAAKGLESLWPPPRSDRIAG